MKYLNQLFQVVEDGFVTCLYEKPSVIFCNTSFQNILHLDGPRLGASRSVMLPTPELGESACTQANLADNGFFRNWVAGIVFGFVNLIKSEALLNFYTPQGTGYSEVIIIQTSSHPLSTPGYWWCLCARPQLFPCLLCVLFSTRATRYLFTVTYQGSSILNQWWKIRIPLIITRQRGIPLPCFGTFLVINTGISPGHGRDYSLSLINMSHVICLVWPPAIRAFH